MHTHRLEHVRMRTHVNIHCGKFPFLSRRLSLASSDEQTVLSSEQRPIPQKGLVAWPALAHI